jgi:hypothetical protein
MAHTHEFDCPICGAHIDSQKELDEHNRKKHTAQASEPSSNPNANRGNESPPNQRIF